MIGEKRYKMLRINGEMLPFLLNGIPDKYEVDNPLPKDIQIVNVRLGFPDVIEIIIAHESFDIVPIDKVVPDFVVRLKEKV